MMKKLKPLIYSLALISMAFGSCKHRDKSLLNDAGDMSFWKKEIMHNNDTDSTRAHLTDNQKSHLCSKLNSVDFHLIKDEIYKTKKSESEPESEVVWGYLTKNKGDMVGDTIAFVANTFLVETVDKHSNQFKTRHTSLIQFRPTAHNKGLFYDHVITNFCNNDRVTATKNTFINDLQ